MALIRWATVGAFTVAIGGCFGGSSNDDGEAGSCDQHSGTWLLSGTCAPTSCTVTQSGCTFTMNCDDQTTFNGSFNGNRITFNNAESNCSGTLTTTGTQVTGTCSTSGETCNYTGQCSGSCSSSSGGSGGSGGSGATTARGGSGGATTPQGGSPPTGGSGGSGGEPPLDPTCETGTNAVCSCLVGTADECLPEDAQLLYDGCVAGIVEAEFVGCFADYVVGDTVDCTSAANACIPAMP